MKSSKSKKVKSYPSQRPDVAKTMNELLWNFGSWLTEEDEYSDVVISSRIRLARNVKGVPFPARAPLVELAALLDKVERACRQCPSLGDASFIHIDELDDWDCRYFVERRLASPQFIERKIPSLLVIGQRENLNIMVNEEDHLRIQCIEAGLNIQQAWRKISTIDDELEEHLNFSYSGDYGYLTSCPTNIGTGMRVSFSVHLPALSLKKKINAVFKKLPASEIAVRGFYGEGSDSIGSIFQISNQLTLGRTETNVIKRMTSIAKSLIELERNARKSLLEEHRLRLEDEVFRALGILKHARIISSLESMDLLSTLRLGAELGLINQISSVSINQLMVIVQPAHLQKIYRRSLTPEERDALRAEFIRQNLYA